MKGLVLIAIQQDKSGFKVLRAYDADFKQQAESDLAMLEQADACSNMTYSILECEIITKNYYD